VASGVPPRSGALPRVVAGSVAPESEVLHSLKPPPPDLPSSWTRTGAENFPSCFHAHGNSGFSAFGFACRLEVGRVLATESGSARRWPDRGDVFNQGGTKDTQESQNLNLVLLVAWWFRIPVLGQSIWFGTWDGTASQFSAGAAEDGQTLSGGDKVPGGDENWIPAGDGDPFFYRGKGSPAGWPDGLRGILTLRWKGGDSCHLNSAIAPQRFLRRRRRHSARSSAARFPDPGLSRSAGRG
jgi:hypothetical protein